MKFWKEHMALRAVLMLVTFVGGIVLMLRGWFMTGQLAGLGLMMLGVACLLATLYFYNTRFAEDRHSKSR